MAVKERTPAARSPVHPAWSTRTRRCGQQRNREQQSTAISAARLSRRNQRSPSAARRSLRRTRRTQPTATPAACSMPAMPPTPPAIFAIPCYRAARPKSGATGDCRESAARVLQSRNAAARRPSIQACERDRAAGPCCAFISCASASSSDRERCTWSRRTLEERSNPRARQRCSNRRTVSPNCNALPSRAACNSWRDGPVSRKRSA